jgi:hypothetical protein
VPDRAALGEDVIAGVVLGDRAEEQARDLLPALLLRDDEVQIGRASCRERVS